MAPPQMFRIADPARLFAGEVQVARPAVDASVGFRAIPADPLAAALSDLCAAIAAQDAFCLSRAPLPTECTAAAPDFLTLTGGSTGAAKVIRRTQASWIASFEQNAKRFDLARHGSVGVLGSLAHSLSLYAVVEGLHLGLDVHVLADLPASKQRAALRAQGIATLYATPSQLRLLTHGRGAALPALRHVFCGGGALDTDTQNAMETLAPHAQVHQFYGAAETSFVTITDATTPRGSVGKPYPGVSIKLEAQEIWIASPYLFTEYAAPTMRGAKRHAGFVSVGELGHQDAEGNLWITGRMSRQVKVAEQLVSPEAVEAFVQAHPNGGPCAVLPIPDTTRGNRLALVLQGATDTARAQALKDACVAEFGPLVAPRRVVFHATLPLLPSGKIDLAQIARLLEAPS